MPTIQLQFDREITSYDKHTGKLCIHLSYEDMPRWSDKQARDFQEFLSNYKDPLSMATMEKVIADEDNKLVIFQHLRNNVPMLIETHPEDDRI